jgi:hypothetical protein
MRRIILTDPGISLIFVNSATFRAGGNTENSGISRLHGNITVDIWQNVNNVQLTNEQGLSFST